MFALAQRLHATSLILRALLLTPLSLTLWWFLLKAPSLWLLHALAWLPLAILIAPYGQPPVRIDPASGDWTFNVLVNATGVNLKTGVPQFVESIEFAVSPDHVACFAFGWFSYLAFALSAAGASPRWLRSTFIGLALQTALNIFSLTLYAYINGYGAIINPVSGQPLSIWLLKYLYHLVYLVVPFAGPFAIALATHAAWRDYCLRSFTPSPKPRRTAPAVATVPPEPPRPAASRQSMPVRVRTRTRHRK